MVYIAQTAVYLGRRQKRDRKRMVERGRRKLIICGFEMKRFSFQISVLKRSKRPIIRHMSVACRSQLLVFCNEIHSSRNCVVSPAAVISKTLGSRNYTVIWQTNSFPSTLSNAMKLSSNLIAVRWAPLRILLGIIQLLFNNIWWPHG